MFSNVSLHWLHFFYSVSLPVLTWSYCRNGRLDTLAGTGKPKLWPLGQIIYEKLSLFKREPVRKGPQVQVELVHILEEKNLWSSHKISLNSKWGVFGCRGVGGCGALRRLLHEAKFRLGATTGARPTGGYPDPPDHPRRTNEPPGPASSRNLPLPPSRR